jgi:hypothetical protein
MAKPNYQFEKRQREQQKKQKKIEKAQRKAQPAATAPETDNRIAPGSSQPAASIR